MWGGNQVLCLHLLSGREGSANLYLLYTPRSLFWVMGSAVLYTVPSVRSVWGQKGCVLFHLVLFCPEIILSFAPVFSASCVPGFFSLRIVGSTRSVVYTHNNLNSFLFQDLTEFWACISCTLHPNLPFSCDCAENLARIPHLLSSKFLSLLGWCRALSSHFAPTISIPLSQECSEC